VDSLTPEERKFWEFSVQGAMQKNHKTLAQLISADAPRVTADASMHIIKQHVLNDKWAYILVKVTEGDKHRTLTVVLRKIDGEWKMDEFE
jgi:hypothetical protein